MDYNPFSLQGKTILITGASSGIGKATAIECSKMGAVLIITGRSEERLNETFEALSTNPAHKQIAADLTSEADMARLISSVPVLDGLVHCAAIIKKLPLKFISQKSFTELSDANIMAPALLTQGLFRKKLLQDGASIVFISSIAARIASLGNIMYMATKGAINSLARGIALEVAEKKIRVNTIEPALVKTNLTAVLTQEDMENYEKRFPLGRFGEPEEIAHAAIYFLSDASKWVTGSSLTIDGGVTLR